MFIISDYIGCAYCRTVSQTITSSDRPVERYMDYRLGYTERVVPVLKIKNRRGS